MPTYQQQMRQIERRRKLAEMLMQQGGQSQLQDSGRFLVGPSNFSAAAGLASALGGAYLGRKSERDEDAARASEQARLAQLAQMLMGGGGDPGVDGASTPPDPRAQAAREMFGGLPVEAQQQALGGQALKAMFPAQPKPEPFTLKPGETRYGPYGKPLANLPGIERDPAGFSLSPGETRFDATGKPVANLPAASPKPKAQWKSLAPEEITAAGLPAGTSAQRNLETGEINVLSKRDNTGTLSQKDATTAKMKLNTVRLARQQLRAVKEAFDEGRTGLVNFFGPVQGWINTPAGKKFDARIDQMRSTLTALTRVPGVGAMSDYETKLDQAKFPERGAWESVTEDKISGLEDMLALIETGYNDVLSGGAQPAAQPQGAAQPSGEARITNDAEYDALPSGTVFVGPDGMRRRKP